MSGVALALIVAAAVLHASWNYLAKRASGGAPFAWLFGLVSCVLYAPPALTLLYLQPALDIWALGFIFGSGLIHTAYFLSLQRGYGHGDLSLVYPLARGTGPLLAVLGAILAFGERPSLAALAGAALIIAGVLTLSGLGHRRAQPGQAVFYGLLTGALIAGYTLWDKYTLSGLLVAPLVLDWGSNVTRTLLLTPYAWRRQAQVRQQWREHRGAVIGAGVLCPLSYILVLTALAFTPVSYVAPARELSIVFGVLLGAQLLAEQQFKRRLTAAMMIVLGVIALSIG